MDTVIEVTGLRKEYRTVRGRRTVAVDGLDLHVPRGGVFGFLGPNGSGKTTTIRCLLGLVRPTAGRCRVLGADAAGDLHTVIRRVGAIVEAPALFADFSGRRNLELLARLDGIPARRIDGVLDRVGLGARGDQLVNGYSLGMKQRLAIAAALLKDPEVLILDEPANGLDPAGMKDVRDILRTLGSEGRTVFVSSHLLGEIQQTCDRVAILSRGRCIAAGRVEDVLAGAAPSSLIVRLDDLDGGLAVLCAAGFAAARHDGVLRVGAEASVAGEITRLLAERGLYVTELRPDDVSLEAVFLDLTREEAPVS